MTQPVLILDDGELEDVANVLAKAGVPFERLRGGQIPSGVSPPLDLLVTTPRRARAVRRGSPRTARRGRPLRVLVSKEDSGAMRRMLKRMGFHLLVRRPTHPETWRLLKGKIFRCRRLPLKLRLRLYESLATMLRTHTAIFSII